MCLFFFSLINGTLCIKCLMAHLLFFLLFVCLFFFNCLVSFFFSSVFRVVSC